jgi:glycosyltransferase involved in cell wall biosynthesis
MKLSVIIPAYKEPFLQRTIDSILENSKLDSEIEVLPILDGPWLTEPLKRDHRVKVIQLESNLGMRAAINTGITESTGEYLLKIDAHCAFGKGFDRILVEDCKDNWLMIPRRYSLEEIEWTLHPDRSTVDYHYLHYPSTENHYMMTPHYWRRSNDIMIDDTMTYQGSCWVVNKQYFMENIGLMDDNIHTYGPFISEMLEVGLKYWLGGGEVKVNKKTWYAHLFKMTRHYATGEFAKKKNYSRCFQWAARHWINNEEPGMIHPLSWLIEKFWPVPTWPQNRENWHIV